jgi:hypothetical protein
MYSIFKEQYNNVKIHFNHFSKDMATKATLIDPKTGKKVVVDTGSQTAQQFCGK